MSRNAAQLLTPAVNEPLGMRRDMACLQVCNAIFDQSNALQNAGERRHLLAPVGSGAPGDEAVCDGRIQARRPPTPITIVPGVVSDLSFSPVSPVQCMHSRHERRLACRSAGRSVSMMRTSALPLEARLCTRWGALLPAAHYLRCCLLEQGPQSIRAPLVRFS